MPQQVQQAQAGSAKSCLRATYTSLENAPFQISQQLDLSSSSPSSDLTPAEQKKQQRIRALAQLRKAASTIQASVNKELTQRMEEDKAREAATNSGSSSGNFGKKEKGGVIDDEAEEQNYGEEVVEDSD